MSTKPKMMKQKTKQPLKPKLRFPKFRDAPEWVDRPFRDLYDFKSTNTFSRDKLNYETGTVRNIHYGDIHTKFQALFDINREIVPFINPSESLSRINSDSYCVEGDMIFADASEDLTDVGKSIEIVKLNGKPLLSGTHTLLARPIDAQLAIGFGGHLFRSPRICARIRKEAHGAKVSGISAGRLSKVKVYFPAQKAEQQKIADCLSSLDALIAAHGRKLAALKDHKQGLMQQLFPRENKTQPHLRFPEFRDAGEWVQDSIQDLMNDQLIVGHLDGNHGELYPRAEEFSETGVPYLSANDFKNGYVDFDHCKHLPIKRALQFRKGIAKNGDILFAHNATVGPVAKLVTGLEFVVLSTTATYFRCDQNKLLNDFLLCALASTAFVEQYTRVMSQSTRDQVPITAQRKFKLQIPGLREQQRIAACLSSLDTQITAQTEQIEAIKTHKKGLMQQLFP